MLQSIDFFFSSIFSQVFSETLSVSHHTCTSYINSFPQINRLRTDVPMSFKAAAKLSGVPAAQSLVPAYLGRANLLLGAQFPFRVPCWWARARTVFKASNLLRSFWLKLAIEVVQCLMKPVKRLLWAALWLEKLAELIPKYPVPFAQPEWKLVDGAS